MTFCGIVTLRFRALSQVGLLLVALGVHPTAARSQAILGTLVEAETGAGIEGALIILLDESGDQLSWRLTDTAGRFNFQIDRSGRFQLRADRIGHASVLTDLTTLDGVSNSVQRIEAPGTGSFSNSGVSCFGAGLKPHWNVAVIPTENARLGPGSKYRPADSGAPGATKALTAMAAA